MKRTDLGPQHLAPYFHLPIEEAARNLSVCVSSVKRLCRRLGIPRWPQQRLRFIDSKIIALLKYSTDVRMVEASLQKLLTQRRALLQQIATDLVVDPGVTVPVRAHQYLASVGIKVDPAIVQPDEHDLVLSAAFSSQRQALAAAAAASSAAVPNPAMLMPLPPAAPPMLLPLPFVTTPVLFEPSAARASAAVLPTPASAAVQIGAVAEMGPAGPAPLLRPAPLPPPPPPSGFMPGAAPGGHTPAVPPPPFAVPAPTTLPPMPAGAMRSGHWPPLPAGLPPPPRTPWAGGAPVFPDVQYLMQRFQEFGAQNGLAPR